MTPTACPIKARFNAPLEAHPRAEIQPTAIPQPNIAINWSIGGSGVRRDLRSLSGPDDSGGNEFIELWQSR
jgi:hypothetical protein